MLFGDFGESVGFRVSEAGLSRTIDANLNRQPFEDAAGSGPEPFAGNRPAVMHVMVRNHATLGVLPSEIVEDQSEIEVASKVGGTARWRRIIRIVRQNAGCLTLEVQS